MGCILCGKEIGPLRLLRDKEFCSAKHRQRYKDNLILALGQAEVSEMRPAGVARFIALDSPKNVMVRARADLRPFEWVIANVAPEPRLPLVIDSVAGTRARRIPFRSADHQGHTFVTVYRGFLARSSSKNTYLPSGLVLETAQEEPAKAAAGVGTVVAAPSRMANFAIRFMPADVFSRERANLTAVAATVKAVLGSWAGGTIEPMVGASPMRLAFRESAGETVIKQHAIVPVYSARAPESHAQRAASLNLDLAQDPPEVADFIAGTNPVDAVYRTSACFTPIAPSYAAGNNSTIRQQPESLTLDIVRELATIDEFYGELTPADINFHASAGLTPIPPASSIFNSNIPQQTAALSLDVIQELLDVVQEVPDVIQAVQPAVADFVAALTPADLVFQASGDWATVHRTPADRPTPSMPLAIDRAAGSNMRPLTLNAADFEAGLKADGSFVHSSFDPRLPDLLPEALEYGAMAAGATPEIAGFVTEYVPAAMADKVLAMANIALPSAQSRAVNSSGASWLTIASDPTTATQPKKLEFSAAASRLQPSTLYLFRAIAPRVNSVAPLLPDGLKMDAVDEAPALADPATEQLIDAILHGDAADPKLPLAFDYEAKPRIADHFITALPPIDVASFAFSQFAPVNETPRDTKLARNQAKAQLPPLAGLDLTRPKPLGWSAADGRTQNQYTPKQPMPKQPTAKQQTADGKTQNQFTAKPGRAISPASAPSLFPLKAVPDAPALQKFVSGSLPVDVQNRIASNLQPIRKPADSGLESQLDLALQAATRDVPAGMIALPENLSAEETSTRTAGPPQADFIAPEYYCGSTTFAPTVSPEWMMRPASFCFAPPFKVHPVPERLEPASMQTAADEKFDRPAPLQFPRKPVNWRVLELAAAGVILAVLTGFGMRFASRIEAENPAITPDVVARLTSKASGPIAGLRHAIANRAALQVSDTFRSGMQAWGQVSSWAPGWSRRPEGFVETGQLALFEPSMKFKDYRMEFFGEIESKSMGWVVRAKDKKNYDAMKFTVIQTGLRPVIAMVHYPVTNGRAGKAISTPLMQVMVHNNHPYQVDVAVKGNHIVTSIEGQEVDRWVEDGNPAGGVGFYSEAGARARLYWLKVYKNEDFLGKVCAYLSGSEESSRAVAFLIPKEFNYGTKYFNAYAVAR